MEEMKIRAEISREVELISKESEELAAVQEQSKKLNQSKNMFFQKYRADDWSLKTRKVALENHLSLERRKLGALNKQSKTVSASNNALK